MDPGKQELSLHLIMYPALSEETTPFYSSRARRWALRCWPLGLWTVLRFDFVIREQAECQPHLDSNVLIDSCKAPRTLFVDTQLPVGHFRD
jgi:hypothetical protein